MLPGNSPACPEPSGPCEEREANRGTMEPLNPSNRNRPMKAASARTTLASVRRRVRRVNRLQNRYQMDDTMPERISNSMLRTLTIPGSVLSLPDWTQTMAAAMSSRKIHSHTGRSQR